MATVLGGDGMKTKEIFEQELLKLRSKYQLEREDVSRIVEVFEVLYEAEKKTDPYRMLCRE